MSAAVGAIVVAGIVLPAGIASADELGGWGEDTGSFTIAEVARSAANGEAIQIAATAQHTGKKEEKVINGTSSKRAVGNTTWTGVYHYTRARVEGGEIPTDSGRKWGTTKTSATSPWQKFSAVYGFGTAKTYYGH